MPDEAKKMKVNSGRIGENIVTNEFLARGFLVTHLDKGTRGVSANADLLVGHEGMARPALIQVKASLEKSLDYVFLGSPSPEVLDGKEAFYNRKAGFKADFLAAVVMTRPNEYRVFILPIAQAEKLAVAAITAWHRVPTKNNDQRKPQPKLYCLVNPSKKRPRASQESQQIFGSLSEAVIPFESRYDILRGDDGAGRSNR